MIWGYHYFWKHPSRVITPGYSLIFGHLQGAHVTPFITIGSGQVILRILGFFSAPHSGSGSPQNHRVHNLLINGVYWGYNITHLLTIDPNFLGHPSRSGSEGLFIPKDFTRGIRRISGLWVDLEISGSPVIRPASWKITKYHLGAKKNMVPPPPPSCKKS